MFSFSFLMFQDSFSYIFLFRDLRLAILSAIGLLAGTIFDLCFPSAQNVLISSVMKYTFVGYRFWLAILLFQHLEDILSLLTSLVSGKKSTVIQTTCLIQVRSHTFHFPLFFQTAFLFRKTKYRKV